MVIHRSLVWAGRFVWGKYTPFVSPCHVNKVKFTLASICAEFLQLFHFRVIPLSTWNDDMLIIYPTSIPVESDRSPSSPSALNLSFRGQRRATYGGSSCSYWVTLINSQWFGDTTNTYQKPLPSPAASHDPALRGLGMGTESRESPSWLDKSTSENIYVYNFRPVVSNQTWCLTFSPLWHHQ